MGLTAAQWVRVAAWGAAALAGVHADIRRRREAEEKREVARREDAVLRPYPMEMDLPPTPVLRLEDFPKERIVRCPPRAAEGAHTWGPW